MAEPETHLNNGVQRDQPRSRYTPFMVEQFRYHYDELHLPRVRVLLAISAIVIVTAMALSARQNQLSGATATFVLVVMLPLILAALVSASHPRWRHLSQSLLTASALSVGLMGTSLILRASLQGISYYFAGEIAIIFAVWLVLGLRFRHAATAALIISAAYVWGSLHWSLASGEILFSAALLLAVNGVGAVCCFQFERNTRRAFLDRGILVDQAERDPLTGLYNRRAFDAYIERVWRQAERDRSQLTVMLIDTDRFKDFNDLYGHQAGDNALRRVADLIARGAQRPLDLAARYGGEEFVLVLYGLANDTERALPEQIRREVQNMAIPHAGSTAAGHLTVSIGVAIVSPGGERSLAGAIQMADEALYQAKEEGRNRVSVKECRLTSIQTGRFRAGRRAAG